jgi:hypothetical protein
VEYLHTRGIVQCRVEMYSAALTDLMAAQVREANKRHASGSLQLGSIIHSSRILARVNLPRPVPYKFIGHVREQRDEAQRTLAD